MPRRYLVATHGTEVLPYCYPTQTSSRSSRHEQSDERPLLHVTSAKDEEDTARPKNHPTRTDRRTPKERTLTRSTASISSSLSSACSKRKVGNSWRRSEDS